jgi:hypothetical protein
LCKERKAGEIFLLKSKKSSRFVWNFPFQASIREMLLPNIFKNSPCRMNTSFLIACLCLGALGATAQQQFTDTFPGTHPGPHWLGDPDLFTIHSSGRLQLDDSTGGTAWLCTRAPIADTAVWEGLIALDFPPSTSNQVRVYLSASHESPDEPGFHGYFLQIGASGTDDCLEFWRHDPDGERTLLISGVEGAVADHPEVRYRMTRSRSGMWILTADYSGGSDFQHQGNQIDSTHSHLDFFALKCTYTSTRKSHFYFDDFQISPLYQDTLPPVLEEISLGGDQRLRLTFSEPLDSMSAAATASYSSDRGAILGAALTAPDEVELHFSGLQGGEVLTLKVSGLSDRSGNVCDLQSRSLTYFLLRSPEPWDLLIYEIYADPDTTRIAGGLPGVEWVELYNRSGDALWLEGVQLADDGRTGTFPSFTLLPDSVLLVCAAEDREILRPLAPLVGLENFPNLNNDADHLRLLDSSGRILHSVAYDRDWYRSTQKDDGGYSLEMIAPQSPCIGRENWTASEAPLGGTPGRGNSVYLPTIDQTGPTIVHAFTRSEHNISLVFSEALDSWSAEQPEHYAVDGWTVWAASHNADSPERVMLTLENPLEPSAITTVRVLSANDCIGNSRSGDTAMIALPEAPVPGDIVLNEILFNPAVGGKDFVEFLNRSDKVIDMSSLTISNGPKQSALLTPFLLFPGQIVAYSESPDDILARYKCPAPWRLFANPLPTFGPDTGTVMLISASFPDTSVTIIDSVRYDESYHHPLLSTNKGVSLERIGADMLGTSPHTWQSAAESWGFATPTGFNSQSHFHAASDTSVTFSLEYRTFSPDGDGYRDLLRIAYHCDRPGYVLRAGVFDAGGRPISLIANNQSLGQSGILVWDGVMESRQTVQTGIYIILAEAHHPDGRVIRQRMTAVLSLPVE